MKIVSIILNSNVIKGHQRQCFKVILTLDRVLNFRRAPLVTGRRIDLIEEISPVAAERLKYRLKHFMELKYYILNILKILLRYSKYITIVNSI